MAENGETRTIRTEALARVEGEGAMQVKIRGGEVENVELQIYEPPRFFEAFLRGRDFKEAPGHHRADLRDLPGRLHDQRLQRDGGRARGRGLGRDPDPAPHHVLRRVDRVPRAPRLPAPRAGLPRLRVGMGDGARPPRGGRGRPADQGDGQRAAADDRRPRDPPDQRAGGRFLQGSEQGRDLQKLIPGLEEARELARSSVAWVAGLDFPDFEQDYEFVALRHPDRYAIEDGRLVSGSGLDIGPGEYEEHFSEQHVRHSTALQSRMSTAAPTSSVRWRGTRLTPRSSPTWRGRRPSRRGWGRTAATRSSRSSSGPWRSSTPSTRRCG